MRTAVAWKKKSQGHFVEQEWTEAIWEPERMLHVLMNGMTSHTERVCLSICLLSLPPPHPPKKTRIFKMFKYYKKSHFSEHLKRAFRFLWNRNYLRFISLAFSTFDRNKRCFFLWKDFHRLCFRVEESAHKCLSILKGTYRCPYICAKGHGT